MATDYDEIKQRNKRRYGTDIGRIGPMLLSERYADNAHFIFELLQNAEDALSRRGLEQKGSRSVRFEINQSELRVSHFGKPFDKRDVEGICGIAESTKSITDIGRFGIGFKSVYAVTDRPEVHSGNEDFLIENFVWPRSTSPLDRKQDETVFVFPLKPNCYDDIKKGLNRLGAETLLFLREIEAVEWSVGGSPIGVYTKSTTPWPSDNARQVTVTVQQAGNPEVSEQWLVFSRPVLHDTRPAGFIEIAFSVDKNSKSGQQIFQRPNHSPLVAFFPTALETHLGFLLQGPYRTTPSRDNIPHDDDWNSFCVQETAALLVESMRSLRDNNVFGVDALNTLPLDRAKFDNTMFAPIFDATKQALGEEPLLPSHDRRSISAKQAMIARSGQLRELFSSAQLTKIFTDDDERIWLGETVSRDRTPELWRYLTEELKIPEATPDSILSKLDKKFLEEQNDEWVQRLYTFLEGQKFLHKKAATMPLIRIEDGTHHQVEEGGKRAAYLAGPTTTDFPTVRKTVCAEEEAKSFLRRLGLEVADAADDILENVLPKYDTEEMDEIPENYTKDIDRIARVYADATVRQQKKLVDKLKTLRFVVTRRAGEHAPVLRRPIDAHMATEGLKELFGDVPGVNLVDDTYECLREPNVCRLLEDCGTSPCLKPEEVFCQDQEFLETLRKDHSQPKSSGQNDKCKDAKLYGLETLIEHLSGLEPDERYKRAMRLWKELAFLLDISGENAFKGLYTWTYHGDHRKEFDTAFIRLLNKSEWIPDTDGMLKRPELISFDSLGWASNPFLESVIRFKPKAIEILAKEAGIDPGLINLLRSQGIKTEEEFRQRFGLEMSKPSSIDETAAHSSSAAADSTSTGTSPSPMSTSAQSGTVADLNRGTNRTGGERSPHDRGATETSDQRPVGERGTKSVDNPETLRSIEQRSRFHTYIAVSNEEPEHDRGQSQEQKMALEDAAIELILSTERENFAELQRMPPGNEGYDIQALDSSGMIVRYIEVKSLSSAWETRPVTLSRAQFLMAQQEGETFWLYVVERADTAGAKIHRINNPASNARYFTYDDGWANVANYENNN